MKGYYPKVQLEKQWHIPLSGGRGYVSTLTNGNLLIDNNQVENLIRPLALRRKNYFAGSHDGAKRAALFYSLFATCKLNGIDPYWWMRDVLMRIQDHPINRLRELLPTKNYQFMYRQQGM